jgi:hypothetical protein
MTFNEFLEWREINECDFLPIMIELMYSDILDCRMRDDPEWQEERWNQYHRKYWEGVAAEQDKKPLKWRYWYAKNTGRMDEYNAIWNKIWEDVRSGKAK